MAMELIGLKGYRMFEGEPLTQQDIDAKGCAHCGEPTCGKDEPSHFHAQCHMEAPLSVMYYKGVLTLRCAECDNHIADIAVASDSPMKTLWN